MIGDTGSYYGYGILLHTENGGLTWENQYNGDFHFEDIFFIDNEFGYIVGDSKTLFTTDGGDTWIVDFLDPYGETTYFDVFFADSINGWILGNGEEIPYPSYFIVHTSDGGNTWEVINEPSSACSIHDIFFINSDNGWVVTEDGIYYTQDGGDNWIKQVTGYGGSFLHFTDANNGWAVGPNGTILHTNNGGIVGIEESPINYEHALKVFCYPNPFTNSTSIYFTLMEAGFTNLEILDISGRKITTLHSGFLQAGEHSFIWNADGLSEGMYLLRMESDGAYKSRKLLFMK